ncbi:MAG: hypothetical protein JOY66_21865, partial [Acetobacteraceae bacterium]|nr:hypothetical protein [Acetobacteraceae bacterium]
MKVRWVFAGLILGFGLVFSIGTMAQTETSALSLKEVPVPKPTAAIIACADKDHTCPDPNTAPDTISIPGPKDKQGKAADLP